MREFWALVKRELKSIKREKTIMFAIFIQLFIAAFSSMMLVGVMAFYDPDSMSDNANVHLKIGVVDNVTSPIAYYVDDSRSIEVERYPTIETAERDFQKGRIDAVMSIPFSDGGIVNMKLILPESDTESMLVLMILDGPLKEAENYLRRTNGIELNYTDVEGKPHTSHEFLYTIIIPLLMFFPALIAGSITIDTISEEIQNKTLDTLWSAPLSLIQIFTSKIFTAILTAFLQCLLWIFLLALNSITVYNIGLVLLLAVLVAAFVSFGSAILALFFRDRERAQFAYSFTLLITAGLSTLASLSPFALMTILSSDGHNAGFADVIVYLVPIAMLFAGFLFVSRRLAASQT